MAASLARIKAHQKPGALYASTLAGARAGAAGALGLVAPAAALGAARAAGAEPEPRSMGLAATSAGAALASGAAVAAGGAAAGGAAATAARPAAWFCITLVLPSASCASARSRYPVERS